MTTAPADRARAALEATPRRGFLPPDQRAYADLDRPLPIGFGQTNSQPRTVHDMLTALDPRPGASILDVGCGSGWTTAALAWLVGPGGTVIGVERIPELVAWGRENLATAGRPWARIEAALPDRIGWPAGAPYDRILVSAMADRLPEDLLGQLAPDGRLVIPVGGHLLAVSGEGEQRDLGRYLFVPLVEPG